MFSWSFGGFYCVFERFLVFLDGLEDFYDVFDGFYRALLVFSIVFLCFPGVLADSKVCSTVLSCFWRVWRLFMMF